MRDFKELNPDEKIPVKFMLSAKHVAILQEEAKKMGLTMSGYLNVYLNNLKKEKDRDV